MKKMTIFLLFIFSCIALFGNNLFCAKVEATTELNKATVIASKCFIYSEKDFSKKIDIDGENIFLKHGDSVTILKIEDEFALIECDKIPYQGEKYIYRYYLSQNQSQTVYPVFNGKLRRNAILYDNEFKEKCILKKNTKVYIYEGFEKSKYTAVQVVLDNDQLYMGYIKTENIKPNGVNGILIAGISIIIASVTIILSLVFIKKKNKKKTANQKKQN